MRLLKVIFFAATIFTFSSSLSASEQAPPLKLCSIELPLNVQSVIYIMEILEDPRDIQNFALAFPVYAKELKEVYYDLKSFSLFGEPRAKITIACIQTAIKRKSAEQGFKEVRFKRLKQKYRAENERFIKKNRRIKQVYRDNIARHYVAGANFSGSDLSHATFDSADFSGANFSLVPLPGSQLIRCNLSQSNFAGANLAGAFFRDCNLDQANFAGAVFYGTRFKGCNLDGANFLCAILCVDGAYVIVDATNLAAFKNTIAVLNQGQVLPLEQ